MNFNRMTVGKMNQPITEKTGVLNGIRAYGLAVGEETETYNRV